MPHTIHNVAHSSQCRTQFTMLHTPDQLTWPIYLTCLPDLNTWPTSPSYLTKKAFSIIQFCNSCNVLIPSLNVLISFPNPYHFPFSPLTSETSFIQLISHSITVTGPGKLTVGKLYGGILIYEIWKTTRFSNLEILAKVGILTNQVLVGWWWMCFGLRWKERWRLNWRLRGATLRVKASVLSRSLSS